MTEEIWIDGIEHLESSVAVNSTSNNSGKKDYLATFNTSMPFIPENNNTNQLQSPNLPNLLCSDVNQNYTTGKIITTFPVFNDMIELFSFFYIGGTYHVQQN